MDNCELSNFHDPLDLAHTAASAWLTNWEAAKSQNRPYLVALSGGRIAKQFFTAIVQEVKRRVVTLDRMHFFWADERCVPPDHAESNFNLANVFLFQPLQVPAEQIHRLRGEIAPAEAVQEGAAELEKVASHSPVGLPKFDIIFLGMGEDGHVASLFPDLPEEQKKSKRIYLHVVAAKPPPRRITLSYEAIRAAEEVWVLASGPGKEEALRKSLLSRSPDSLPQECTPLGRVVAMRSCTKIMCDIDYRIGGRGGYPPV
jgi:6-phosphogluconolactonase